MRGPRKPATGPATSPQNTSASTRPIGRDRRLKTQRLDLGALPIPVGELVAQRGFLELADRSARNFVHEDEGIGELPLCKAFTQELAQIFWTCPDTLFQHDYSERPLL